jgi:hypothetical protein
MARIKYFIRTYFQLPMYKSVWDNVWRLQFLLDKMMEKKPASYPFPDLEKSINLVSFDPDKVRNYRDVFPEYLLWNWDTVLPSAFKLPREVPRTSIEETQKWIEEKQKKSQKELNEVLNEIHKN